MIGASQGHREMIYVLCVLGCERQGQPVADQKDCLKIAAEAVSMVRSRTQIRQCEAENVELTDLISDGHRVGAPERALGEE